MEEPRRKEIPMKYLKSNFLVLVGACFMLACLAVAGCSQVLSGAEVFGDAIIKSLHCPDTATTQTEGGE